MSSHQEDDKKPKVSLSLSNLSGETPQSPNRQENKRGKPSKASTAATKRGKQTGRVNRALQSLSLSPNPLPNHLESKHPGKGITRDKSPQRRNPLDHSWTSEEANEALRAPTPQENPTTLQQPWENSQKPTQPVPTRTPALHTTCNSKQSNSQSQCQTPSWQCPTGPKAKQTTCSQCPTEAKAIQITCSQHSPELEKQTTRSQCPTGTIEVQPPHYDLTKTTQTTI